jgi:hypothetical protein
MEKFFSIDEHEGLTLVGVQGFYSGFSRLMYGWEKDCYAQHVMISPASDGQPIIELRNRLKGIFTIFVAEGGKNLDRLDNLVCSVNPEYDPVHDSIVDIELANRKAYLVIEKKAGLAVKFRLTFVAVDGFVKIKKREFESEAGKWKATYV